MKIMKFGGSSVAESEKIEAAIAIISADPAAERARGVVVSAFGDVTDDLIELANLAREQNPGYKKKLSELKGFHSDVIGQLCSTESKEVAIEKINPWFQDLEDVLNGVSLIGELSSRSLDFVMSFGEKLSAFILATALKDREIDAEYLEATEIIFSDGNFGNAKVKRDKSYAAIQKHFEAHKALQIVTGFIASSPNGDLATLGRGGSDYTAALLAAALGADRLELWTDVNGILTADPRKVPKAFTQESITYEEIMELSHFGAKVVYPPTIQPVLDKDIPVFIRNTFNPDHTGTKISSEHAEGKRTITGISSIDEMALLRVEGSGMVGVAGTSTRLFGSLARSGINIILITQASSEHSICLAVKPDQAQLAKKALEEEFALEIQANLVDPIILEDDCSIVSVVGENMKSTPGVAGKVFSSLGKNGVNVMAIAQGSSEFNISAVVARSDEVKALNALHEEFFYPDNKVINVFLVGKGLIGTELLKQLEANSKALEEEHSHELNLIGIAGRSKQLISPDGIGFEDPLQALESEGTSADLDQFIEYLKEADLPNRVFVDCTAEEDVANRYREILEASVSVVAPNKKAMSGDLGNYQQLKQLAKRRGVEFLYETNVGAGLPVLSTLNDLLKSGDQVIRLEAVLSGTLSYIFNSFVEGTTFSEIVKTAQGNGLTEPDPRDDLNGIDVARKILILGREIGLNLALEDVEVENLVPEKCRSTESIDEFFTLLGEEDEFFENQRATAAQKAEKLCYIASLEDGKAVVALKSIDSSHPFYSLSGSDNIVSFTTRRYSDRPLVIKGPGAGAGVTAAGVFADIIRIGN